MEEKTNNALEKAENATDKREQTIYSDSDYKADNLELRAERMVEEEKVKATKFKNQRMSSGGKGQNGGKRKGLVAAVVALSVATVALSSALMITYLVPSEMDTALEHSYRRSFYDAVEQVDNIDLNLSKVLVTSDEGAMQRYLMDTAINSELAENDVQNLPLQDENKYYTTKLINQIGDYAKYLNNKIISGQKITEKDKAGLRQLYNANKDFKNSLNKMMEKIGSDFSFSTVMQGGAGNPVISNFNELQNLSVQYPELIYDGPFSDGQQNKQVKGLSGQQIDKVKAVEIFSEIFSRRGVTDAQNVGEASGNIECYNVQGTVKDDLLFAQISKTGGKLIMFDFAGSCNGVKIDEDDAAERGLEFLSSLGIKDMKPVWINLANNVYTINYAYSVEGVIVYADLIKIRVCAETDAVIGMEAKSYYSNHVERSISTPALSASDAREKVFSELEINTERLALVPIGQNGEKLCYEFSGQSDGATYYVYIDAESGRQVELFKVVEGTEGQMLM